MQQQNTASVAAAAYRYWQLFIYTNNGGDAISFAEIEIRTTAGGLDLTSSGTPAQASSVDSGYVARLVLDNSTDYNSVWIANGTTNQSIAFDLLTPQAVQEIAIFPSTTRTSRTPKNFVVRGSNASLSGPWTDIKTFDRAVTTAVWQTYSLI